jgi:hypothetical protein
LLAGASEPPLTETSLRRILEEKFPDIIEEKRADAQDKRDTKDIRVS